MTQHLGYRRVGVICEECHGRSYSDPTATYHYPDCSQYAEWRFGSKRLPNRLEAEDMYRSHGLCPHGAANWVDCPTCTDAADFDGGE